MKGREQKEEEGAVPQEMTSLMKLCHVQMVSSRGLKVLLFMAQIFTLLSRSGWLWYFRKCYSIVNKAIMEKL